MITNLTQYLEKQNQLRRNKIAIYDNYNQLTFGELRDSAVEIANKIYHTEENLINSPIVIFLPKGIIAYVALFGVLYSGNYYVPIDIKMPKDRLKKIIKQLNSKIAITSSSYSNELLSAGFNGKIIVLDSLDFRCCNDLYVIERISKITDLDPAYVLFTSGSTGTPKGVVVTHRGVIDYIEWQCNKFNFNDSIILANQAPFYFDASVPDIYTPVCAGSTLCIIPNYLFSFPNKLIDYLNTNKVNTLIWVPSALITMTSRDFFDENLIGQLQLVMFCGEVMPNKHLNIWRKYYPNVKFVNLYGPTEAVYACTYYEINREFSDDEPLPIGKACENTEILVLNEDNKLVMNDEVGELCVRGACLSLGYFADSEKSRAAFIQNPLNPNYRDYLYRTGDLVRYNEYGEIIYIGRKDFQIKRQGYRIELGEIETAAYGMPQVKQCCAVYNDESKEIILYCVLSDEVSDKNIYSFMKERLPKYMLPGEIKICAELPLNANGKIDRIGLVNRNDN